MSTINFREVNLWNTIKVKCKICGKSLKRVAKVYQTVNPFNKREDGIPKSIYDIRAELPAAMDAEFKRISENTICRKCEESK